MRQTVKMWDLRIKNPSNIILSGATQSGKSTFAANIISQAGDLFLDGRCKQNIIYYYKEDGGAIQNLRNQNIVQHWVNELPTVNDVKERTLAFKDRGGSIVVIDDFGNHITQDMIDIVTVISHHYHTTVILLVQNLFQNGSIFRTMSLNVQYLVVFKNPRDQSQIGHLAKQFAPGKSKNIVKLFQDNTKKQYSYILFDFHQSTPEHLRIRTDILVHEAPMQVFLLD
jgi:adenosyl cobinamide kinase/adenosyl cobinamide phosphate guanylyltransferase